jgi:hypothetical protein
METKMKLIPRALLVITALLAAAPQAQAGLAVKNFREIFDSLVVSTGVSPTDQAINDYYSQSFTRLPMTGAVGEVSSSGLLTLTALSGMFCSSMIASDAKLDPTQRRATQAVDFTKSPRGLSAKIQESVIEAYFGLFLSRSPSPTELQALKDEFTEAAQNLGDTAADTPSALSVVCTSVASSLESLIL